MARRFLSLYCPGIPAGRLTPLVEWCDRYSPLAAQDGAGIILDITGCAHLWGGEAHLLFDLRQRLRRMGIAAREAVSDTWGRAWALARYGKRRIAYGDIAAAALDGMPVEALRLSEETVLNLRSLGLSTIASVRKISRDALSTRFDPALLLRLDQAFHYAEEPFTPWRPPAPYRAARTLHEPITTVYAVEHILDDLLREICGQLERSHLGSRHMDLACHRLDGTMDRCEVRTSKPARSIRHLARLFSDRLHALKSGFGFETFVLSVLDIEALPPSQRSLFSTDAGEEESPFDALVDRLGMRLGFDKVNRVRVCESYLPEKAVELRPIVDSPAKSAEWPSYRLRPIRLIDPPMSIEVSLLIPGESPVQFLAGSRKHSVVRSEGPERLTAEWWRGDSRWATRDYYRIEDEQGFRFWIFRDPEGRWFLHGHLP